MKEKHYQQFIFDNKPGCREFEPHPISGRLLGSSAGRAPANFKICFDYLIKKTNSAKILNTI